MQYTGTGVAFSIFGIEVRWYAIFIVTGMALAVYLSAKEAKRRGLKEEDIYDLALYLLPCGVIGARIWYILFEWDRFQGDLLRMINLRTGGLAIQGGIMAALLVGYWFTKKRKIPFWVLCDIIFPYVAMAQAIGRWGNFTNNEAYGGPTNLPWALIINGQKVHPTFLYESLGNLCIFLFLRWVVRFHRREEKPLYDGIITSGYLVFYGVLRFLVEGLRQDSLWWGPIRVAQMLALIGLCAGVVLYVVMKKRKVQSRPLKQTA